MMTPAYESAPVALLYPEIDSELARTRGMLQRFPDGHTDWKPHARSRSLGELATHIAAIPRHGCRLIEQDEFDVATQPRQAVLATAAELLAMFDQSVAALQAALPKVTAEALEQPWTMRAGPA